MYSTLTKTEKAELQARMARAIERTHSAGVATDCTSVWLDVEGSKTRR